MTGILRNAAGRRGLLPLLLLVLVLVPAPILSARLSGRARHVATELRAIRSSATSTRRPDPFLAPCLSGVAPGRALRAERGDAARECVKRHHFFRGESRSEEREVVHQTDVAQAEKDRRLRRVPGEALRSAELALKLAVDVELRDTVGLGEVEGLVWPPLSPKETALTTSRVPVKALCQGTSSFTRSGDGKFCEAGSVVSEVLQVSIRRPWWYSKAWRHTCFK